MGIGREVITTSQVEAISATHAADLAPRSVQGFTASAFRSKTIASSDVVGFAQLTGDRNPIHLSEHFAAKTQFGKRIAHGLYTASLISAVLGTRLPGPGAVYISQTLNFRAPVKIGDQVDVTVTVAELVPERRRARLTCSCAVAGEIVLDGEALVKVPSAEKSKRPLPHI